MTIEQTPNPNRYEYPDDTPIAKPLRWNRQGSTLDQIRAAIGIANREAAMQGTESFEEADDFEVGDDFDPKTRWELQADAAYMSPEELYEHVFKKPYKPPAMAPGATDPTKPGDSPGNHPLPGVPPLSPLG